MKSRRPRGYVMLVVLLVLLVLGLVVVMSLRLGGNERRAATLERDRAEALALAEAGLERTHAFLVATAETGGDLDRALDPNGDTTCTSSPPVLTLGGNQSDDHLPPFTDGAAVVSGPAGLSWQRVAQNGGAWLVRIDDNADDADPSLPATATNNTGACVEGLAGTVGQTPVRDRDDTVTVTSVGVYPGTDPTTARATRVLEATFGPPPAVGIAANGTIDMTGASHACGAFASVSATGDVADSCLCGTGCPGANPCATNELCEARAGGTTCNTSASGGGADCLANQPVPTVPRVNPWDRRNTPPACAGASCTPFYYLRWNGSETQVYLWNYAGTALGGGSCTDPAAWARICHPADTAGTCAGAGCWQLSYSASASGGDPREVRLPDGTAANAVPPITVTPSGANPLVWETHEHDDNPSEHSGGCGTVASPPDPWPSGGALDWNSSPEVTFRMKADGHHGERVPRGVWFVEGNVEWDDDSEACASLPVGWSLSLLVLGDATFNDDASFKPASRRAVAVVTGRDLELHTGNTDVVSCTSGAFLVHEQFHMGGNMTLEGQLVVDNRGSCSNEVSGTAVQMNGTSAIFVNTRPPIAIGAPVMRRGWAESTW